MTENCNTIKYRLGEIEKKYGRIEERLVVIMENHLPHINVKIVELKTRMNVVTMINVSAIILGILLVKAFG